MIRPFTFITMILAALSGAYLFGVKHRAQALDDQLATVMKGTQVDELRVRWLQAQWALEIDPTRLKQLSAAFSPLRPMQPAQLVTLAALRDALPPPASLAPAANPVAPPPEIVADAAAAPALPGLTAGWAAPDLPLPPPVAPAQDAASAPPAPRLLLASAGPRPAARLTRAMARPQRLAASHLANSEFAASLPPPRPLYSQAPAPIGAAIVPVSAAADGAPPDGAPPDGATSDSGQGGSLLGMASDMAPPQPIGTGN